MRSVALPIVRRPPGCVSRRTPASPSGACGFTETTSKFEPVCGTATASDSTSAQATVCMRALTPFARRWLVGHWLLGAINHEHIHRSLCRFELQPELLLDSGEDRRRIAVRDWRRRAGLW